MFDSFSYFSWITFIFIYVINYISDKLESMTSMIVYNIKCSTYCFFRCTVWYTVIEYNDEPGMNSKEILLIHNINTQKIGDTKNNICARFATGMYNNLVKSMSAFANSAVSTFTYKAISKKSTTILYSEKIYFLY